MCSLLGDGDLSWGFGAAAGAKYGEVLVIELEDGDNMGGLLDSWSGASSLAHGPLSRFSDTADNTGDGALGALTGLSSLPSA